MEFDDDDWYFVKWIPVKPAELFKFRQTDRNISFKKAF